MVLNQKDRIYELETKLLEADATNKELFKFKENYMNEVEKAESLKSEIERQKRKFDDADRLNDLLRKKIVELEAINQKALQEKADLKHQYENLLKENEMSLSEKLRQFDILLKEKDMIVETQRNEIDRSQENERRLIDRIHELEVYLLREKEAKNRIDTNYEKLLGDHNILLKRHDLFTSFANDTRMILN